MSMNKICSATVGNLLRDLRRAAGVRNAIHLAKLMGGKYSSSGILRREEGLLKIDSDYVDLFCKTVGVAGAQKDEILWQLRVEVLRKENTPELLELEFWQKREQSKCICTYSACLIPSALQTFNYAKAIIETYKHVANVENSALKRVQTSMRWLNTPDKTIRIICSETALYLPTGNIHVMVDQLRRLRLFTENKTLDFRIFPNNVFVGVPLYALFTVFDETYSICETRLGASTSEDRSDAQTLLKDFGLLWEKSASNKDRNQLIDRALTYYEKEYPKN